jgi:chaperonin GroES
MMKTSIKPIADNVLIEPLERETKTPAGIVIPDTAKEKPQEGKVVAVGPGKRENGKRVELPLKPGDRVLYRRYGGNEIKVEGKDYLVVGIDDILAVVS